jgi:hypothetical protein
LSKKALGLEPVSAPPHVFALDAGRLRYACFPVQNGHFELSTFEAEDLESESFAGGPLGGSLRETERLRKPLQSLLERLPEPATEASLLLPDAWLRLAFVDSDKLPRAATARDEVLRWKLQRTIPFKVDELRLRAVELSPLESTGGEQRLLVGFGLEQLFQHLEEIFAEQGVHVGQLTSESLATMPAVQDALRDVELGAIVLVSDEGYSLGFVLRGEPLVHRHRSLRGQVGEEFPEELVLRDLKLTEVFLSERAGDVHLGRVLLISPPPMVSRWMQWLERIFGLPVHALELPQLPLEVGSLPVPLHELAPMFGAARQRVL